MGNEIEELLATLGNFNQAKPEADIKLNPKEIPKAQDLHTCIYQHIYGLLQCESLSQNQIDFIMSIGHLANTLQRKKGE